ncbi:MAG: SIMPL domain-containing protein [Actinobacteria bacterium]|nr:SIMPL domain-containing protein [Actinomycetota bacterium]
MEEESRLEDEMQRSTISILAAAAIGLAACTAGQETAQLPNITVNTGETQSGISVSGTGEVTGTPDTVTVNIGVSVRGETIAEASALAAEKADALINSLTSSGVDPDDITTTNYSIWPEYDYRNNREKLIGYRVDNTVRAKIRDVGEAGNVLDSAVEAGGDAVRVNGLSFSIEDDTEMIEAARQVAWNDALAKAQQLADLSGQTLGPAITISESFSRAPTPIPYETLAFDTAASVETPIEPGTSAVTISIQVQFALEG